MTAFADLGLDPRLLRALDKKEYETPTPVQVGFVSKLTGSLLESVKVSPCVKDMSCFPSRSEFDYALQLKLRCKAGECMFQLFCESESKARSYTLKAFTFSNPGGVHSGCVGRQGHSCTGTHWQR